MSSKGSSTGGLLMFVTSSSHSLSMITWPSETRINKILKFLRIDNFIYPKRKLFAITFIASGKEEAAEQVVHLTVKDVNRGPRLLEMEDIFVNEGETISLHPKAVESDNDRVYFWISEPVGKDGKWQTSYTDEGTYEVTVTATDGQETDLKKLNVTVNHLNQPPFFEYLPPVEVFEGDFVKINPNAWDDDSEQVEIDIDPWLEGSTFDDNGFSWTPGYDAAEFKSGKTTYTLTFTARDEEEYESTEEVTITVKDRNRAPELVNTTPETYIKVDIGEPVTFKATAQDPDSDTLYGPCVAFSYNGLFSESLFLLV